MAGTGTQEIRTTALKSAVSLYIAVGIFGKGEDLPKEVLDLTELFTQYIADGIIPVKGQSIR